MRLDSVIEYADAGERRLLLARYKRDYLALAMLVSVLNYIPPLFLVTPVLSALAFGHYSLAALRAERKAAGGAPSYPSALPSTRTQA
jgi:hypothetical protein